MSEVADGKTVQKTDETVPSDGTKNTEGRDNVDSRKDVDSRDNRANRIPYERFKEKVDEVNRLKEKLAAIEKEQKEAKRKELEAQNEYKQLYEQAQAQIAAMQEDALNAKKDALLAKAGYTDEQIEKLRSAVTGETDEEITQSVEELKAVIAPKPDYADPSPMNGSAERPEPESGTDLGRSLFEKLKSKGRIR